MKSCLAKKNILFSLPEKYWIPLWPKKWHFSALYVCNERDFSLKEQRYLYTILFFLSATGLWTDVLPVTSKSGFSECNRVTDRCFTSNFQVWFF